MKKILDWLIELEEMAGDLYRGAALEFNEDEKLSDFLMRLAEDEAMHYRVLKGSSELLDKEGRLDGYVNLDSTIKENIEQPFTSSYDMLASGSLTRTALLDCIVTTEFSEFNHIFMYFVNTLKSMNKKIMYAASAMQDHLSGIEVFLESQPDGQSFIQRIHGLPEVWRKKILVVEDFEPIAEFLKTLLTDDGAVEIARDGAEGLEKIKSTYFDAIISDVDMPRMDGIEFYKEASVSAPEIGGLFLFYTSDISQERKAFFEQHGLRFLQKPASIEDIKQAFHEIFKRASNQH